jgi:hypothetical protein
MNVRSWTLYEGGCLRWTCRPSRRGRPPLARSQASINDFLIVFTFSTTSVSTHHVWGNIMECTCEAHSAIMRYPFHYPPSVHLPSVVVACGTSVSLRRQRRARPLSNRCTSCAPSGPFLLARVMVRSSRANGITHVIHFVTRSGVSFLLSTRRAL